MRMEKKYNLLDMILQKHEEHSSDWEKDNPVGSRNMKIQQSDYDTYGRSDLLKEARELEGKFGNGTCYKVTGQVSFEPCWPASKILWVKKNEPQIFQKTDKN